MLHIIIINYNTSQETINCINSICSCNIINNIRIVVIDNNSSSTEYEKLNILDNLSNNNVQIIVKQNNKNIGFSGANNIGLGYANYGDLIWFLNNDTLVNQKIIDKIFNTHIEDNCAYYCNIYDFDNKYESTGLHYINLFTGHSSFRKKKLYVEYICGASLIMKFTKNMPKWDEKYFLYFEDVDLSLKLKKLGYKFILIDDCYINHRGQSSVKNITTVNTIKIRSQIIFIKKNGYCFVLYIILRIIYLLFFRRLEELKYFITFLLRKINTLNDIS